MASPIGFGGLDVETIVNALVDAERGPVRQVQGEIVRLQGRLDAFNEVSSALRTLDGVRSRELKRDRLSAQVVGSSDEDRLTGIADGTADVGAHEIEIHDLAQADRHRSQRYDDRDSSPVAHGTLELEVDGVTTTVEVDDSNDTLQGVADAINAANDEDDAGVRASIVHDGTGDVLVLTSKATGKDQDVVFVENTTDLSFTQTLGAQDASFTLDGVDITSATNTIEDALKGVTLELHEAETGQLVRLDVTVDVEASEEAIGEFVDAVNNALSVMDRVSRADTTGNRSGGPLVGDATVRTLKADLIASVTGRVSPEDEDGFNLLSEVGVSFDRSGRLSVDSSKLRERLREDPAKVSDLFMTIGTTSDAAISYVTGSAATEGGTYGIEVAAAAEQATLLGDHVIPGTGLALDERLTITVMGETLDVDLLAGDTIGAITQKINDAMQAAALTAVASDDGGRLRIATDGYGSAATLEVTSSLASADGQTGFDLATRTDEGVDVAGTIGGEAATGRGRVLIGDEGTAAEGLRLIVGATAPGSFGEVTFRPGLGTRLERAIDRAVDSVDGRLPSRRESIESQLRSRRERVDRLERALSDRADILRQKFTAAQQAMAALEAMQASLSGLA